MARYWSLFSVGFSLSVGLWLSGCDKPTTPTSSTPAEVPQAAEAPAQNPEPEKRPNLLKRKTSEVVDKNKAQAENPQLIEVENKITGSDPLTTSLQGYIAMSSRVNVLNFQHQIQIMKAAEDRNPTYQEILDLIRQHKMEFNALPDYQMYAYDEKEGRFTILEDPEEKERLTNPK